MASIFGNIWETEQKKKEVTSSRQDKTTLSSPRADANAGGSIFGDVFGARDRKATEDAAGSRELMKVVRPLEYTTDPALQPAPQPKPRESPGWFNTASNIVSNAQGAISKGIDRVGDAIDSVKEGGQKVLDSTTTDHGEWIKQQTKDFLSGVGAGFFNIRAVNQGNDIIGEQVLKMYNSPLGQKIVKAQQEASSDLYSKYIASMKGDYEMTKAVIQGNAKTFAQMNEVFDRTYEIAYAARMASKNDPNNSAYENFLEALGDSAPQSLVGTLLAMGVGYLTHSPTAAMVATTPYYMNLSAAEQIQKKGKVYSWHNLETDTIGDSVLNGLLLGAVNTPANIWLKLGLEGGAEGGTEVIQSVAKLADDYANAKTDEERKQIIEDAKRYITSGDIAMEFGVGALVGLFAGSVAAPFQASSEYEAKKAAYDQGVASLESNITNNEAYTTQLDRAIEAGDMPADRVYSNQSTKTLTEQVATGRINDIAQNMERAGMPADSVQEFRTSVDAKNTTITEIVDAARTTLSGFKPPVLNNFTVDNPNYVSQKEALKEKKKPRFARPVEGVPTVEGPAATTEETPTENTDTQVIRDRDALVNQPENTDTTKAQDRINDYANLYSTRNVFVPDISANGQPIVSISTVPFPDGKFAVKYVANAGDLGVNVGYDYSKLYDSADEAVRAATNRIVLWAKTEQTSNLAPSVRSQLDAVIDYAQNPREPLSPAAIARIKAEEKQQKNVTIKQDNSDTVKPLSEIEGMRKANPELYNAAVSANSEESFIEAMAKGMPESVDTEALRNFYNKVKPNFAQALQNANIQMYRAGMRAHTLEEFIADMRKKTGDEYSDADLEEAYHKIKGNQPDLALETKETTKNTQTVGKKEDKQAKTAQLASAKNAQPATVAKTETVEPQTVVVEGAVQERAMLASLGKFELNKVLPVYRDTIRHIQAGDYVSTEDVIKAHSEYKKAIAERKKNEEEADAQRSKIAEQRWGNKTITELEKELEKMGGDIASLQKSGRGEINDGARSTRKAVSNEGARQLGSDKMLLASYIDERKATDKAATAPTQAGGIEDRQKELWSRINEGKATVSEYKDGFEEVVQNKQEIKLALSTNTKDQLLNKLGRFSAAQHKNDKKADIVDVVYDSMVMRYSLGKTVSYMYGVNPGGVESASTAAVRKIVSAATLEDLAKYSEEVAQYRSDMKKRIEDQKKALSNPETADEFRTFITIKGKDAMTPEMRARYDSLVAQATKEKQQKTAESKGVVPGVNTGTQGEIKETKHTKTGEDLYVVVLKDRVEREQYKELVARAKKLGGWYSMFRGNGAIPGFQFKDRASAENFLRVVAGETVQTDRYVQKAEDKKEKASDKLRATADSLEERAKAKLNVERKTNTARRARLANSAEADAEKDIATAKTMRNIADAIDTGKYVLLENVTSKTQIDEMDSVVRRARYNEARNNNGKRDNEGQYELPPVSETTYNYVDAFPGKIYHAREIVEKGLQTKRWINVAKAINKNVDADGTYTPHGVNQMDEFAQMAKEVGGYLPGGAMEMQINTYKRFRAMGVVNTETLRALMREYVSVREEQKTQDIAKKLERDLVGRKDVGIDFFPTPKRVAAQMVSEAEISEGMSVLEPSAGNGNIAEVIRDETGVSPQVMEISGALRDVLEAKGFDVIGHDFMEEKGKYDRIVMNPPFSNHQDIQHVRHAYELLNPGGKVVAIMGEGAFFRSQKEDVAFREWLDEVGGVSEKLPEGTFKDIELLATTGTNARVVTVSKSFRAVDNDGKVWAEKMPKETRSNVEKYDLKKHSSFLLDYKPGGTAASEHWVYAIPLKDREFYLAIVDGETDVSGNKANGSKDAVGEGMWHITASPYDQAISGGAVYKGETTDAIAEKLIQNQEAAVKKLEKELGRSLKIVPGEERDLIRIDDETRESRMQEQKQGRDDKGRYTFKDSAQESKDIEKTWNDVATKVNRAEPEGGKPSRFLSAVNEKAPTLDEAPTYNEATAKNTKSKNWEKESQNVIRRSEIAKTLAQKLNVTIRYGKIPSGLSGQYDSKTNVIRLSSYKSQPRIGGNLTTIFHEVGHFLDNTVYGFRNNITREEAMALLVEYGNKDIAAIPGSNRARGEAFSEFLRFYMTQNERAQKIAPKFYTSFKDTLEKMPEVRDAIETARNGFEGWNAQDPEQKIIAQIQVHAQKEGRDLGQLLRKTYEWMLDDLHPLEIVEKEDKRYKDGTLTAKESFYTQARLVRSAAVGKANTFLEKGTFARNDWWDSAAKKMKYTGKSFREIVAPIVAKNEDIPFMAYMAARRAVELAGRDKVTGIELADAQAVVAKRDKVSPEFKVAAEQLYTFKDAVLQYAIDGGFKDQKTIDAMREMNQNYIPFKRVRDELENRGLLGNGIAKQKNVFQKLKGSERMIENPLQTLVTNTYIIFDAVERNAVLQTLAKAAEVNPQTIGPLFERVKEDKALVARVNSKEIVEKALGVTSEFAKMAAPSYINEAVGTIDPEAVLNIFRPSMFQKGNVVTVIDEGKPKYYVADKDLYGALNGLEHQPLNIWLRLVAYPARFLRAGATLTPEFFIRNLGRDAATAALYTKNGFIPVFDTFRGIAEVIKRGDLYQAWVAAGGDMSQHLAQDKSDQEIAYNELVSNKAKFKKYALNPIESLRFVSGLFESATRLGEMKRAIEAKKSPEQGAFDSREVTIDFGRAGAYGRVINQINAFFQVTFSGTDKMFRAMKADPVKFNAKAILGLTIPSIILLLINRQEPDWDEIPQWQKDTGWLFKISSNGVIPEWFQAKEGDPLLKQVLTQAFKTKSGGVWVRMPKPWELGMIYGSLPERFVEYLANKDPEAMGALAHTLFSQITPNVLPTAAQPILENLTNYSFFFDRPIVSKSLQNLPSEEQYNYYTPEVVKMLGQFTGTSPLKIQNIIQGYFAGLGQYGMDIADWALIKTGAVEGKNRPLPTPSDIPGLRAFVVRDPIGSAGASLNKFYEKRDEAAKTYAHIKDLVDAGKTDEARTYVEDHPEARLHREYEQIASALTKINAAQTKIRDDENMSPLRKRQLLTKLDEEKTRIAQNALEITLK